MGRPKKYKTDEEREEAKKAQARKYYQKNKEKVGARSKKYYQANKDKLSVYQKEYQKEYRQANKDKRAAWFKEYYQKNKEKYNAYNKEHYQNNKEEYAARGKKYREENREKYAAYGETYNKEYREANRLTHNIMSGLRTRYPHWKEHFTMSTIRESIGMSEEELKVYLGYDKETYGKKAESMTVDHIKPLREANTVQELLELNHYTNLQLLSKSDNSKKS